MKRLRLFLVTAALLVGFGTAQAQWNYVVDVLRGDSTALCQMKQGKSEVYPWVLGDTVKWLHNGDTVHVARADSAFQHLRAPILNREKGMSFVIVTMAGQRYFVKWKDLKYTSPLEDRTYDIVKMMRRDPHNALGHFYIGSAAPYWMIFLLVLCCFLSLKIGSATGGQWHLWVAPILLAAAIVLELVGIVKFWANMLWWIDPDYVPLGWVFARIFLFIATLIMQVTSMSLYRAELTYSHSGNPEDGNLKPWWPLLSILLGIVAFLVINLIWKNIDGDTDTLVLFACMALMLAGIVYAGFKNCKVVGTVAGILFTVFSLAWSIGLVLSGALCIAGLFTAIWQFLETGVGAILIVMLLGKAGLMPSGGSGLYGIGAGNTGIPGLWRDKKGGLHATQGGMEDANNSDHPF